MTKHKLFVNSVIMATLCLQCQAIMMRNNALINKMVSHFQKNNSHQSVEHNKFEPQYPEQQQQQQHGENKQERVLNVMQNVLCRNFPSIPCEMITGDDKLKKLIEKSIQQIKHKSLTQTNAEKTTSAPNYLTLFPIVNSEELSNFLQVRDHNTFYKQKEAKVEAKAKKKKSKNGQLMKSWSQEATQKKNKRNKKDSRRNTVYTGRKKIRKFYPHKIKYKDKSKNEGRKDFKDYSEEKLSMSVEIPDMTLTKHHQHLSYKVEPADPPVWRIDYMKHGEPSLNLLGYEDDRLRGKLMKTGPSVIVDENFLEQSARKDVLHPDVYIKKNFSRKGQDINNSEN